MSRIGRSCSTSIRRGDGLVLSPRTMRREQVRQNLVRIEEALLRDPAWVLGAEDVVGVVKSAAREVGATRAGRKLDFGALRAPEQGDPIDVAHALARLTGKDYEQFADAIGEIRHLDQPGRFAECVGAPCAAGPIADAVAESVPSFPLLDSPAYAARARGLRFQGLAWVLAAGWPRGLGVSGAALCALGAVTAGVFGPLAGGVAALSGAAALWGGTGIAAHRTRALHPAEAAVLARAADAPLGFEEWAAFFARFAGDASAVHGELRAPQATLVEQALLELAKSRGPYPERAPEFSGRAGMWSHVDDCAELISLLSRTASDDAAAWRHLSGAIPSAMLHRLNWQPYVYRPDRLAAVAQAQAAGKRIIFVASHRSHYDTPTVLAFLQAFAPAIAAKRELLVAPWIGSSALRHPWQPTRWRHDGALAIGDCILVDRDSPQARAHLQREALQRFDAGRSILIFGPGTRDHTPVPGLEYGLSPYTAGMANVASAAAARGEEVLFVPIHLVGPGSVFNTDVGQFWRHGIRLNPRVLMGVGEPVSFTQIESDWLATKEAQGPRARQRNGGGARVSAEDEERLHVRWVTRQVWAATARELLPLQRFAHTWEPPLGGVPHG